MPACFWDTSKAPPLSPDHPLQLLLRVAHGLESLLDPFRAVTAGACRTRRSKPHWRPATQSALCWGALRTTVAAGPVSPELLERLGVRNSSGQHPAGYAADSQAADGREAAFRNTTSQCVEMIAGCFQRIESGGESTGPRP